MSLNSERGFTLLELLIGMTLSIVIFVILFSAMRLAYKSQDSGTEKAEMTQKMRIVGDRITWLIRGTYPYFMKKTDEQKLFFEGKSNSIGFVTTSVDTFGTGPEDLGGLKWVSIFQDGKGLSIREKVYFLEDAFDDSGGKLYVLDTDVTDLEFEYFNIPENEKQGDWISEWDPDDKEYLPSAVRVKITFERNEKKIQMPELIVKISTQRRKRF